MSAAKKAVDSTFRKILIYTAEIIMSIILLIVICIPVAFGIPIWFQTVVFGAARAELVINPIAWFGEAGAFWVTLLLSLVSIFLGYVYVYRLVPSAAGEEEEEPEAAELDDEDEAVEEDAAEESPEADAAEDDTPTDTSDDESD
jgi:H+/Cl- antiporter ClcA